MAEGRKALITATVGGFVPQFELENVKILQELGYEVHYASNFKNPHYETDFYKLDQKGVIRHQIDFVRSPINLKQNWTAYQQLCSIIDAYDFSIVHCHTPMGSVITRLAVLKKKKSCDFNKYKIRVIYTAHGFHFYRSAPFHYWLLFYPVERILAYLTDDLITITQEDFYRAKKFWGIDPEHIYYVPGTGIDIKNDKQYDKGSRNLKIRNEFGISDKDILFVSVGELNKNKNQERLIRAIKRLKIDGVKLLLCGEGSRRPTLEKLIRSMGLEKIVMLTGYRKDIVNILKEADFFVLASKREGLSAALMEAMAAGLPAIVSNIRGNKDLIDMEKGGWLVEREHFEVYERHWETVLKQAITLYNKQPEKKSEMGKYNRNKMIAFSKQIVNVKMTEIYSNGEISANE